jgi:hypothetical protein
LERSAKKLEGEAKEARQDYANALYYSPDDAFARQTLTDAIDATNSALYTKLSK